MTDAKTDAGLYRRFERSFLVRGIALLLPAAIVPLACAKEHPAGFGGSCCSDTEWTTSAELARTYASNGASDSLGCPGKLTDLSQASPPFPADAGEPPYGSLDLLDGPTKKLREKGETACVYRAVRCCPGGRPLYEAGGTVAGRRAVVASRTDGARWTRKPLAPLGRVLSPELRTAIASAWLDDALAEHASVASFARATLELVAVGAPPALLAAHQRAGLQEIRHAERCFALARAYGDHAIDPGPVAIPLPRAGGLARLACDTFVEGCVAETIGALLAARALEACTVAAPREALRIIAADEAAHAALAWRTLAWALREGGESVVRAVLESARALRDEAMGASGAGEALPSSELAELHAHGRLADADVRRTTHDAWLTIIDPLLAKLQSGA